MAQLTIYNARVNAKFAVLSYGETRLYRLTISTASATIAVLTQRFLAGEIFFHPNKFIEDWILGEGAYNVHEITLLAESINENTGAVTALKTEVRKYALSYNNALSSETNQEYKVSTSTSTGRLILTESDTYVVNNKSILVVPYITLLDDEDSSGRAVISAEYLLASGETIKETQTFEPSPTNLYRSLQISIKRKEIGFGEIQKITISNTIGNRGNVSTYYVQHVEEKISGATVQFVNRFGAVQSFSFADVVGEVTTVNASKYVNVNAGALQYGHADERTYTLTTHYCDDSNFEDLSQLLLSPSTSIMFDNDEDVSVSVDLQKAKSCIITTTNIKKKTRLRDKMSRYEITVQLSKAQIW